MAIYSELSTKYIYKVKRIYDIILVIDSMEAISGKRRFERCLDI